MVIKSFQRLVGESNSDHQSDSRDFSTNSMSNVQIKTPSRNTNNDQGFDCQLEYSESILLNLISPHHGNFDESVTTIIANSATKRRRSSLLGDAARVIHNNRSNDFNHKESHLMKPLLTPGRSKLPEKDYFEENNENDANVVNKLDAKFAAMDDNISNMIKQSKSTRSNTTQENVLLKQLRPTSNKLSSSSVSSSRSSSISTRLRSNSTLHKPTASSAMRAISSNKSRPTSVSRSAYTESTKAESKKPSITTRTSTGYGMRSTVLQSKDDVYQSLINNKKRKIESTSTDGMTNKRASTSSSVSGRTRSQNLQRDESIIPSQQQQTTVSQLIDYKPAERNYQVNDFILGKPLGKGKFGNVYHARSKTSESNIPSEVALKVLFKVQLQDPQNKLNLQREIELQHQLEHKNILQLYGFFQDNKNMYLLLEYASNGELYKLLKQQPGGYFPEKDALFYSAQLVSALHHMHQKNIIHRDLKPENILLKHYDQTNNRYHIALADFGSAIQLSRGKCSDASQSKSIYNTSDEILTYTICGTAEYLAPEMIVSAGHDTSLDIWSLGILMYELIYGRTPFKYEDEITPEEYYDTLKNTAAGDNVKEMSFAEYKEAFSRQKMYERIIRYNDDLSFDFVKSNKRQSLSSDQTMVRSGESVSDSTNEIIRALLKARRRDRKTAAELFEMSWVIEQIKLLSINNN